MKSFMDDLESWGDWQDPGQVQAAPTSEPAQSPSEYALQYWGAENLREDMFDIPECDDHFPSSQVTTKLIPLLRQNSSRESQKLFPVETDEFLQRLAELLKTKS